MKHTVIHTFEHTAAMMPFLFLAYLLMFHIERRSDSRLQSVLNSSNSSGPIVGGLLGCIPQCGFSVLAADMYHRNSITIGTLIAVFISTSDEAIPIWLSSGGNIQLVATLIGVKLFLGITVGLIVDRFLAKKLFPKPNQEIECPQQSWGCCQNQQNIFSIALKHTLLISLLIFGVALVFEMGISFVGKEAISKSMLSGSFLQPMIAAAIGFIPNCASSIVLAQLYAESAISFGSVIAGLTTGAGFGIIVLVRGGKNKKVVWRILALLYIIASVTGILLQSFAL